MNLMRKIKVTLSKKMMLIYITCVFLPVLLLAFFFILKIEDTFQERIRESLKNSVEKTVGNIEKTIESAENIAVSVGIDDSMVEILQKNYSNYDEFYQDYDGPVTRFLEEITTASQGMSQIRVYTGNPSIYNSSVYRRLTEYPQVMSWLEEMKKEKKNTEVRSWLRYQNDIEASGVLQPAVCVLYRIPIYNPDYRYEMAIQVYLQMEQIYFWMQDTDVAIRYYLVNPKNQIVASTGKEYEPHNMKGFAPADRMTEPEGGVVSYATPLSGILDGWSMIGVADADTVMEELEQTTVQTGVLLAVIILFSASITILLIRPYTSRLRVLSNRMEGFDETDFSPIRTKTMNDEVEIVISSFNQMMDHMNTLINEVYALNIQKKELELERMRARMNLLISQVNPHFLFNTLNAILVISERNHYQEVSWIIEHLAIMMRKLLDWREDQVCVREEAEFIQMYLDIEKLRFSSQFDFSIEVDGEVEDFRIPKMSVQPLVENACKHGIHKKSGHGYVRVSVRKKSDSVVVRVVNTGSRLTPQRIQELRESIFHENQEEGKGVGLRNVYNRLLLYYKDAAEILMESNDEETCFGFLIHLEEEEDDSDHIGG